jgi:hypothetical protein
MTPDAKQALLNLVAKAGGNEKIKFLIERAANVVRCPKDFCGQYYMHVHYEKFFAQDPPPIATPEPPHEIIRLEDYGGRNGEEFAIGFSKDKNVVVWKTGWMNL